MLVPAAALYLALASAAGFLAFAWDKRCAIRGRRRVPERHLLLLATLGGSPGALLAQRLFRHKTSKQPFRRRFNAILVVQVVLLAGAVLAGRG
ncbi:MAG TPA: DUF1294 domain-containing protein [Azospirillaceae bacterium]|nr:DUF1294 domain-containing protein [Azospirillaceae bacterium]